VHSDTMLHESRIIAVTMTTVRASTGQYDLGETWGCRNS